MPDEHPRIDETCDYYEVDKGRPADVEAVIVYQ